MSPNYFWTKKYHYIIILKMKVIVISELAFISIDLQIRNFFSTSILNVFKNCRLLICFFSLCSYKCSRTFVTNDGFSVWACTSTIQRFDESRIHMNFYKVWVKDESRLIMRKTKLLIHKQ